MFRDPHAREEWAKQMEKKTGKPREELEKQMEVMIEGKPMGTEHKTPVELTGKVYPREDKMTNRLTGILRPKVSCEEITVRESERGATKIKLGNFYFTVCKERR